MGELLILNTKSLNTWLKVGEAVTISEYDFEPKVNWKLSPIVVVPVNVVWSICLTAVWPPVT